MTVSRAVSPVRDEHHLLISHCVISKQIRIVLSSRSEPDVWLVPALYRFSSCSHSSALVVRCAAYRSAARLLCKWRRTRSSISKRGNSWGGGGLPRMTINIPSVWARLALVRSRTPPGRHRRRLGVSARNCRHIYLEQLGKHYRPRQRKLSVSNFVRPRIHPVSVSFG